MAKGGNLLVPNFWANLEGPRGEREVSGWGCHIQPFVLEITWSDVEDL